MISLVSQVFREQQYWPELTPEGRPRGQDDSMSWDSGAGKGVMGISIIVQKDKSLHCSLSWIIHSYIIAFVRL